MNQFVTPDWVIQEALWSLQRSAAARGVNRAYDDDAYADSANYADANMPSFEHIPTEVGREASRRLWRAAGRPAMKDASDV